LAIAAHQSSMMAAWNWKPKSEQPAAQQDATPIVISYSLSQDPEYLIKLAADLNKMYAKAKSGVTIDVTDIETDISTHYAPNIIQPGLDALKELEEKTDKEIAELQAKNDRLASQLAWTTICERTFIGTTMIAAGILMIKSQR
jgi:hypothetical protein